MVLTKEGAKVAANGAVVAGKRTGARSAVEDVLAALSMESSAGSAGEPSKHARQVSLDVFRVRACYLLVTSPSMSAFATTAVHHFACQETKKCRLLHTTYNPRERGSTWAVHCLEGRDTSSLVDELGCGVQWLLWAQQATAKSALLPPHPSLPARCYGPGARALLCCCPPTEMGRMAKKITPTFQVEARRSTSLAHTQREL